MRSFANKKTLRLEGLRAERDAPSSDQATLPPRSWRQAQPQMRETEVIALRVGAARSARQDAGLTSAGKREAEEGVASARLAAPPAPPRADRGAARGRRRSRVRHHQADAERERQGERGLPEGQAGLDREQ